MVAPSRRRFVVARALGCIAFVVGLCLFAAAPASAQVKEITSLKTVGGKDVDLSSFKLDSKKLNVLRGMVFPLVTEGKAVGQQLADFETYYLVRIAELTWAGTKEGAELKRGIIKRDLRQYGAAPSPELHDTLNRLLLAHLPAIAADAQLPLESSFNALILLGQLDRIEPNFAGGIAAEPHADVTPLLVLAFDKQDFPESLRIAALMGLARQSELKIGTAVRPSVAGVALKLIAAKKPLPGFTENGHHWARKLALQMTVGLAKTGNDMNRPETVKSLYDILSDDAEPLFLRRDAALALGQLDPTTISAGQVKPAELLKALSRFTHEVMKAGSPRPNPTAVPTLSKGEDVFLIPTEETKRLYTDGLSYYLNCVATALGGRNNRGLKAAVGGDPKTATLVNELLVSHVDGAVAAMGSSKVTAAGLPQEISSRGSKLAAWMAANGFPLAAAAPAATNPGAVAGP